MKNNYQNNRKNVRPKFNPKLGKGAKIREEKEGFKDEGSTNDPEWYMDGYLAANGANIFFTKPFGTVMRPFSVSRIKSESTTSGVAQTAIPGIMALTINHTFGSSFGNNNAPINIAATAEYAWVRKANSGSRNYDAPDLMTAELALAEVYAAIGHIQRAYGTLNRYYPENRYFARAMVTAMGFDFDDLVGNAAQFAYTINMIISKASAFAMPGNKPYYRRRAMLYQNIYLEDEGIKDQIYMYKPSGFYFYTVDSTYPEGYLKYTAWPANCTLAQLTTYMNNMLQGLLDSEDVGIMSGDIIKAYGDDLIRLSAFDPNYMIQPIVHDYNVLYQIKNAVVFPGIPTADLHQDSSKSYLSYAMTLSLPVAAMPQMAFVENEYYITSNSPSPSVPEVMESTRFAWMAKDVTKGSSVYTCNPSVGTEVVSGITIYYYKVVDSGSLVLNTQSIGTSYMNAWSHVAALTAFKYHPTFFFLLSSWTTTTGDLSLQIHQNFDNVAVMAPDVCENIHQAAIMNMLAAPAIAKL